MVRKLLVLLGMLCLGAGPALAQDQAQGESLESRQFKQRLRGQYLQNDTAQAIINLYSRRQAGGVSWMVAAVLSAVRIGTASSNSSSSYGGYGSSSSSDSGSNVGVAFLVSTPIIAYGAGKLLYYSNSHLNQILTAYAAGQPLPHSLRRKLKPRFFQVPIVKYKEIKVKPAK